MRWGALVAADAERSLRLFDQPSVFFADQRPSDDFELLGEEDANEDHEEAQHEDNQVAAQITLPLRLHGEERILAQCSSTSCSGPS